MAVVKGQVKDKIGVKTEWTGYRASASFGQVVEAADTTKVTMPAELFTDVAVEGTFSIDFPDFDTLDNTLGVAMRVLAPAGEQLVVQNFKTEDLKNSASADQPLSFEVEPQPAFEIVLSADPFLGSKPKLTGRVIDFSGQRLVSNKQVLVFGLPRGLNSPRTDANVIVTARTDPQGYFSADYPRERDLLGNPGDPIQLESAWAVVADARDISGGREIELLLSNMGRFNGLLPRTLILVVDVSDDALAGESTTCDCASNVPRAPDVSDLTSSPGTYSMDLGGGKCVNLTTPNRALEEFSFYTAVRTTDPQILGLGDIGGLVDTPPSILQAIESTVVAPAATTRTLAASARVRASAVLRPDAESPVSTGLLATKIDPRILANQLSTTAAPSPDALLNAHLQTARKVQLSVLRGLYGHAPSRAPMSASNPIDWDSDEPRFYEATTIAHGNLLHFKQVWRADGYSLGDLLYSLPLAPAQKKQIAIVDWERREVAQRSESLSESESLQNILSRDRDISEIVSTTLGEHMHGDSSSFTGGYGQGQGAAGSGSYSGFNFGAVSGSAGGAGFSSAEANQSASRDLAANALQKIRDTTLQAASAVRNQRSTVIQSVSQGETVNVTTEVVTNHNHCHAMTVEYFEVLRHFQITQELVDVQEILYVPLLMSPFDNRKALRWRDILYAFLRRSDLGPGFDAIDRIVNNYVDSDYPTGVFADEQILSMSGNLIIELRVPTGGDSGILQKAFDAVSNWLFGSSASPDPNRTNLQIEVVDAAGVATPVPMEFTLVTEFADRTPLYVRMEQTGAWASAPTRADVQSVHFTWKMKGSDFPDGTQLLIHSGSMRYRTAHLRNHLLFDESHIDSGLTQPEAWVDTPLDTYEQRNPRKEDARLARQLLAHLNEHIEYYHKAIWWNMDADRRFMFLDGFIAPNSNNRSVASVVENRLVGFIGNSMVLPVGPGIHLDPSYKQDPEKPVDLLNLYAPTTPIPPMRVSVPTRGVFAEAVMGACNSCEHMDETRFWRWDQAPTGDEPVPIVSPSTDSRREPDPNLTAKDFPSPIVNIQNPPAEPDPTGLAAALKVIGTPNLFANITGLDQTQKNSLAAMQAALDAAKHFGDQAANLVQQQGMQKGGIDKSMQSIQQAKKQGLINDSQASDLSVSALRSLVGDKSGDASKKSTAVDGLVPSLKNQVDKGSVKNLKATTSAGDNVEAEFAQPQLILASQTTPGKASATTSAPAVVAALPLGFDLYSQNTRKSDNKPLALSDFQDLKSKGRSFVIAKIGGNKWSNQSKLDSQFLNYYPLIRQAGLYRGGYYWFNAVDTVVTQTQAVIDRVKRLEPGDFAPSMDLEDEADSQTGTWPLDSQYHYRTSAQGLATLKSDVREWVDTVETALGRTPIIYTGASWRDDLRWTDFVDHPLWTPHRNAVGAGKKILGIWDDYAIWQYAADGENYLGQAKYSEKGIDISGIDFDAFNGSMYQLRGLADIGRVGIARSGGNIFVAHSELDDHLHLLAGASSLWSDSDLSGSDLPGAGKDPVLLIDQGVFYLYFRSEGSLMEATASAATSWVWETTDLSAIAGAKAVHEPRAIIDGNKRYVVFWGEDNDWHLLTFDTAWQADGILRAAHLGDSTGQPAVYLHQGEVHVAGRVDTDGHVVEAWHTGGGWSTEDITTSTRAVTPALPAATYSPTAAETSTGLKMVLRGVGGHLWMIDRTTNSATDVTAAANAPLASGHPACFVVNDVLHIVYRSADGTVYEIWPEAAIWKSQSVCDDKSSADPTVTSDGTSAVVGFRSDDGMIHVASFDGAQWACTPTKRAVVTSPPIPLPDDTSGGDTWV